MARIGIMVFAVGATLVAVGIAAPRSIDIALSRSWHVTLFLSGLGLFVGLAGICLCGIALLRRLLDA